MEKKEVYLMALIITFLFCRKRLKKGGLRGIAEQPFSFRKALMEKKTTILI